MDRPLRIGTRGSPLALAQANMVAEALRRAHDWPDAMVTLVPITTSGDRIQDRPLADIGGKALWTKELDRALFDGRTDLSVHSMKDVETIRPPALTIAATLARADARDRLIGGDNIADLPMNARIGTSSPRRTAQLLRLRPDFVIIPFRGNVATRLDRIGKGEADATLLAAAGLDRLGMGVGAPIPTDEMLPAPAQGAIGIEIRTDDAVLRPLVAAIDHAPTHACILAERALLAALGGTCHSPIAALADWRDGMIDMRAEILSDDGRERQAAECRFAVGDASAPSQAAEAMLGRASAALRALFTG
jgi:hydroxymethylbilane synthase